MDHLQFIVLVRNEVFRACQKLVSRNDSFHKEWKVRRVKLSYESGDDDKRGIITFLNILQKVDFRDFFPKEALEV